MTNSMMFHITSSSGILGFLPYMVGYLPQTNHECIFPSKKKKYQRLHWFEEGLKSGSNNFHGRNSPSIPNFKEPHPPRNPRLQGLVNSGAHTNPPPTPTSPMLPDFPKLYHPSNLSETMISKKPGLGMSRSISDTTLRRAALHLNLNQSVLPSFTSLQQFKVILVKSEHKNAYGRSWSHLNSITLLFNL